MPMSNSAKSMNQLLEQEYKVPSGDWVTDIDVVRFFSVVSLLRLAKTDTISRAFNKLMDKLDSR